MPWLAAVLMEDEAERRKRARILGRYRKAKSPGAVGAKGEVGRKNVRANDWLPVLNLRIQLLKGRRSLERRCREGQALERARSVGCRRRVLYLSVVLLERDGFAVAIDRLMNSITRVSGAIPHI